MILSPLQLSLTQEIDHKLTEPSGWSRDTNWRQGSAIPERISVSLGLIPENSHSNVAIVISHDCDIVEDNLTNEPTLEVIVGQFITEADPNHTHAKSPNKLHLEFSFEDRPQFIELLSTRKKQVNKSAIAEIEPDMRISLNTNGRGIIQSWLALRYRRAVFPDSLNKHLSLLRETLQAIGKRAPQAIIGFFINFEPDQEIADPDEPYEVWIVIVYDHLSSEARGHR